MAECKQCCGTCVYGSYDKTDGYICVNAESEYVADYTEYSHTCDCWEHKKRKRTKNESGIAKQGFFSEF